MLSSHLVIPREGHLEELLHIFTYMRKHMNTEMVFDPSVPNIDKELFPTSRMDLLNLLFTG